MNKLAHSTALSLLFLCATSSVASAQTAPGFAPATPEIVRLAPADRYFGHLQMSILGIRNALADLALRIDICAPADTSTRAAIFHKLVFVEDALLDLKTKFPRDRWLPRMGLALAKAFGRLGIEDSRVRSNDAIDWIVADYPASDEASEAKDLRSASLAPIVSEDVPIEPTAVSEPH